MRIFAKSGCAFLLLWLASFAVQASCQFYGDVTSALTGYLSFGNVTVQQDTPVGTVIATATTGAYNGGNGIAGCDEAWTYRWELIKWRTLSRLGNNIYNTNLPGVGIRLTNATTGKVLPYDQSAGAYNYVTIPGDGIKAELIKTGDITSGALRTGLLARAEIVNEFDIANAMLTGTNTVISAACQVTTPDVEVRLGDHKKSEFLGTGSGTAWQAFDIGLQCNPGTRINIQIDAAQDPSNIAGVMKLDDDSGDTTATGVGVELHYESDNSAVQFGQSHYYPTDDGINQNVKFVTRYRQTGQSITAGKANATATFTLTYR
ncbi:TPA: fimbrial protein [Citrobacter freundii]